MCAGARPPGGGPLQHSEWESMKARLRMGLAVWAMALVVAPSSVVAQNSVAPPLAESAPPAAANAVGPAQLRDFSLKGTVTRQAEPAPVAPARPTPQPSQPAATTATRQQAAPAQQREVPATTAADRPAQAVASRQAAPPATMTFDLPPVAAGNPTTPASGSSTAPAFAPSALPRSAPASGAALAEGPSTLPWLLAAILAALAGAYYYFRQRSRLAYAGAEVDIVSPRAAAPTPPPPPPAPAAKPLERSPSALGSGGIVSSSLRPWIDFALVPKRVIRAEDGITVEFDIELFNSGGAIARDIELSAALFTANPTQDEEIAAFFAHPPAAGNSIPPLPPLKRLSLSSSVAIGNDRIKLFQVDGRILFVPLIGVSARYRGSGGEAQTAASYVIGRDTQGEKLAPLRADLGPRVFRKLGARQHTVGVRK